MYVCMYVSSSLIYCGITLDKADMNVNFLWEMEPLPFKSWKLKPYSEPQMRKYGSICVIQQYAFLFQSVMYIKHFQAAKAPTFKLLLQRPPETVVVRDTHLKDQPGGHLAKAPSHRWLFSSRQTGPDSSDHLRFLCALLPKELGITIGVPKTKALFLLVIPCIFYWE